jgi:hypothetical protein
MALSGKAVLRTIRRSTAETTQIEPPVVLASADRLMGRRGPLDNERVKTRTGASPLQVNSTGTASQPAVHRNAHGGMVA